MDKLPKRLQDKIEKFISDKLCQRSQGLPHDYAELASEVSALTKKLPLCNEDKAEVVNYIYAKISTSETNGFKPDYDISTMIRILQDVKSLGCGCGFFK
jgi:hypothetical protein